MSYTKIKELCQSGNITAAKAALVEALKKGALTVLEKKSVIRLNSEPLLEVFVAFMTPDPKDWEVLEIIRTGNQKIIEKLEIPVCSEAVQDELIAQGDFDFFERQFQRYPKNKFSGKTDKSIITYGNRKFIERYLQAFWLDQDAEEVLLASNDLELIRLYFQKYEAYTEMLEDVRTD